MDNVYMMKYLELKHLADEAWDAWELSQNGEDWGNFLTYEHACSDYAMENEDKIWPKG